MKHLRYPPTNGSTRSQSLDQKPLVQGFRLSRSVCLGSVLALVFLLAANNARAEQFSSFGDYVAYYNALTTDQIEPAVARPYGILRSKSRALVNISVQKKVMGIPGQAVTAKVVVSGTNLNAQLKQVDMRQIVSSGDEQSKAIYYIGELPVANEETINFTVEVTPEGEAQSHTFKFREQFFTH